MSKARAEDSGSLKEEPTPRERRATRSKRREHTSRLAATPAFVGTVCSNWKSDTGA